MKKFFFLTLTILFIAILFLFYFEEKITRKIINYIENKTELKIELLNNNEWKFYPSLNYNNSNTKITLTNSDIFINNANIILNKSYWPLSPIFIKISSPNITYKGIEMRNTQIEAKYTNDTLYLTNLTGNLIEGSLKLKGKIDFDENKSLILEGQFENISLNTLLKQSQTANWDRVKIKLSSPNFIVKSKQSQNNNWITNLEANIPIRGSLYFTATDEERFGSAILSLLVEKIPSLVNISQSIDFLISTYGNVPSNLYGTLIIKDGMIKTEETIVSNKTGKSKFIGSYNILKDFISGNIYFYKDNDIFLEAKLEGSIENPEILVAGNVINDQDEKPLQNIKDLIEKGIESFVEKLLFNNE